MHLRIFHVFFLGSKEYYVIGWQVAHDDFDGAERQLRALLALDASELEAMGQKAFAAAKSYGYDPLCGRFCDVLECADENS